MRYAALTLMVVLLAGAGTAKARDWTNDPQSVPDWDGRTDEYMGLTGGELLGYATGDEWADEVQVTFQLPRPPLHGPWMISYVALMVSGSGTHTLTIRKANSLGDQPGTVISEMEFTPLYSTWPPDGWTYVKLAEGSMCPPHLSGGEGDCFMIGTTLSAGDIIGLATPDAGCHAWSLFDGSWQDDSGTLQLMPAVRIGIEDLGTSSPQKTTWGKMKNLFGSK